MNVLGSSKRYVSNNPKEEYIIIQHQKKKSYVSRPSSNNLFHIFPRVLSIAAIILIIVGASGFTAYRAGYIPIKPLLDVYGPIGEIGEIDLSECAEKCLESGPLCSNAPANSGRTEYNELEAEICKYLQRYPEIESSPFLSNIRYKIFESGSSVNSISIAYKEKLIDEGYALKYTGTKKIKGISIRYLGFVKGLTAIGIVVADADGLFGYKTIVIYTAGSVFEYKALGNWYKENKGYLDSMMV